MEYSSQLSKLITIIGLKLALLLRLQATAKLHLSHKIINKGLSHRTNYWPSKSVILLSVMYDSI